MACYNILAINCTSAAQKFLPGAKEPFDKPYKVKKMRYLYVIYKRIYAIYYGDNDDANCILEKVERSVKEEM
jgi:hypothetical protein